jgi:O-antigen ligase
MIVLVAAAIGLVWGACLMARGSLLGGCSIFLLAANGFGFTSQNLHVRAIPLTIDWVLLFVLGAVYFAQWCLSRTDPKPIRTADALTLAFVGLLVLSTFTHWFVLSTDDPLSPLYRLIPAYVMPLALFWIARQSRLTSEGISFVQGALATSGVYLTVTGLLEMAQQQWLVFPHPIADPELGIQSGPAQGPMTQTVSTGLALAVCLASAVVWWPKLGRVGQIVLGAMMPFYLAAIYVTYAPSVWIGAALGLGTLLLLLLEGGWRRGALVGMLAAAVLASTTMLDRAMSVDRDRSGENSRQSAALRSSFAYTSWKMFLDRPVWGVGFGHFPDEKIPYLADRNTELNLNAVRTWAHHSTPLSLLTETGLVGLGLFLAMLVAWGSTAWRLWSSPSSPSWVRAHGALLLSALLIYVCQSLFHELSYTPLDNSLMFFLAGIGMGMAPLSEPVAQTIASTEDVLDPATRTAPQA